MPSYQSILQKYRGKGEKTGWTYVEIPTDILAKLKRKDKKGFRIKGAMDGVKFEKLSTYPVGEGGFIIAINAELRKKLGKKVGAMVSIKLEVDESAALFSQELMDCLEEDAAALEQFQSQLKSQQNYFHRYVATAKTAATKAGRIVHILTAMHRKQDFGAMVRSLKKG